MIDGASDGHVRRGGLQVEDEAEGELKGPVDQQSGAVTGDICISAQRWTRPGASGCLPLISRSAIQYRLDFIYMI